MRRYIFDTLLEQLPQRQNPQAFRIIREMNTTPAELVIRALQRATEATHEFK